MNNRITLCRHCGNEIEIEIITPPGVTIDAVSVDAYCKECSEKSEPDEQQI